MSRDKERGGRTIGACCCIHNVKAAGLLDVPHTRLLGPRNQPDDEMGADIIVPLHSFPFMVACTTVTTSRSSAATTILEPTTSRIVFFFLDQQGTRL